MVNRLSGEALEPVARGRHDADDFETKTKDRLAAAG